MLKEEKTKWEQVEREPLFKTDDLNSGSQGANRYSSINLGPDYGSIHSLMGELSAALQLNMQVHIQYFSLWNFPLAKYFVAFEN